MSEISITIDGKDIKAKKGQTIVQAAKENGIYIPVLCHAEGLRPAGICRICTVVVGGRRMAACTTPVTDGMVIENETEELTEMRKAIIEMLFVEGNHFCPACEKSGNCELQALGYRFKIMVPRYPYQFPRRKMETFNKLIIEHNRCVQCRRCVRSFKTKDGRNIFGIAHRGRNTKVIVDQDAVNEMSDEDVTKAMELCPVGSILKKGVGFSVPVGKRKFDSSPIGSDIENATDVVGGLHE
jgi:[NiFe] hydrogenase diaphorase moiety small subunit